MNLRTATSGLDARRGHPFLPPDDELAGIPRLYATDSLPPDRTVIHLHYFVAACDWWVAELDPDDGTAFGFACLGDARNAEWGYVSLIELAGVEAGQPIERRVPNPEPDGPPSKLVRLGTLPIVVERDLYWSPKPFADVEADMRRRWGL